MNDTISRSNCDLFMNDTLSRSNCDLLMNDTISRSNYDLFMVSWCSTWGESEISIARRWQSTQSTQSNRTLKIRADITQCQKEGTSGFTKSIDVLQKDFKARLNLLSIDSFLWEVPLMFLPLCINSTIGLHWIQFKQYEKQQHWRYV